jgi:WD40 repeat protein
VASALVFTSDNSKLFCGGGEIRCYDVLTGRIESKINVNDEAITSVSLVQNDTILVTAGEFPGTARIIDVHTRKVLHKLTRTDRVGIAVAPDGSLAALRDENGKLELVEVLAGKVVKQWETGTGLDTSPAVAFSPNTRFLATCGMNRPLQLWDRNSGRRHRSFSGKSSSPRSIAFSPNGTLVACGNFDGSIGIWDVVTGAELFRSNGHRGKITGGLYLSRSGKIASAGTDGVILLWDPRESTVVRLIDGQYGRISSLARFGEQSLALASWSSGIKSITISPEPKSCVDIAETRGRRITKIAASADGRYIVWTDPWSNIAGLTDVVKKRVLWVRPGGKSDLAVTISADGSKSAICHNGNDSIEVVDAPTGRVERCFSDEIGRLGPLAAISPDGRLLASISKNGHLVRLRSILGDRTVELIEDQTTRKISIAFSEDGYHLAVGDSAGSIRLWDMQSLTESRCWKGHTAEVSVLAFSPVGDQMLSGGSDGSLVVWDVTGLRTPVVSRQFQKKQVLERALLDLGSSNGGRVQSAMRTLASDPTAAITAIRVSLFSAEPINPEVIARWIADLDSDKFEERETATARLVKHGDIASGALSRALEHTRSLEMRRRIEEILERQRPPLTEDHLRLVRIVRFLEYISTDDALALLRKYSSGVADARLTVLSRAALARLKVK